MYVVLYTCHNVRTETPQTHQTPHETRIKNPTGEKRCIIWNLFLSCLVLRFLYNVQPTKQLTHCNIAYICPCHTTDLIRN